jgi:hypothetical protein
VTSFAITSGENDLLRLYSLATASRIKQKKKEKGTRWGAKKGKNRNSPLEYAKISSLQFVFIPLPHPAANSGIT